MSIDPQLQELTPDPAVEAALRTPGLSLQQTIATALDGYAGRPALGERGYEIAVDPLTGRRRREYVPRFDTIGYRELHSRVQDLANTWRHDEHHRVAPGDFVCILGFSGTDYATVDLACAYAHAVSVPLQSTLAGADLDGIFTDTAPTAVAATVDDLVLAAQLAGGHASVRSIIAIDYDERVDEDRERYAAAQAELDQTGSAARLTTLDELITRGDFQPWVPPPAHAEGDDAMSLLLHSSGSTGKPKGAIITERLAKRYFVRTDPLVPVVRMCFAPMNHMVGRGMVYGTLARGGTAYFTARPDLSTLFEDMRLARPTDLLLFPRVLEMIHRHYLGEVVRRTEAGECDAGARVMEDMRTGFLGDRVASMVVGSAPTTPELRRFMEDCFHVTLRDTYASTEAGAAVTVDDRIARPLITDYRLRDVPELGYHTTDKPYPRGELCIKSRFTIPGYYKRPEATAALYDEDGFLLMGDIVEERGLDHVVYIDRRHDVLKLSQGEYVAIGALGTTFESSSAVIHQIYVYGNSARSHLLAVVVPSPEIAQSRLGTDPSEAELRGLIRSELKQVAHDAGLRSFEVPREFIVELEPFSFENGLLSSVRKRLRPALQARYGARLEALYEELERRQHEELMALHDTSRELGVLEKVGTAIEAVLGVEDIDVSQPYSFGELGGDSLAATAFSALVEDIFGVALPVSSILSPAGNAQQWAHAIEAELRGERDTPTFASVHGEGAPGLNAADLDIGRFFDLEHAPTDAPRDVLRTVLLTGATGFLGRFLCLEWLERLARDGGKLICLIRAADHQAATRRLAAAFAGVDPALEERFRTLAGAHLEVLVGDVADTRLGLTDAQFARLADEVDRIVHPAALVNHVLGYEDLFGPNVAGTAEVIRLALTHRQKPIDFVSSVATTRLLDGNDEDSPLRQMVALTDTYGAGYGTSKWAAEHLLHSAHRRFGLPVNVFRGDMMLAHRRYRGQINVPDVFTRLLYSVIMTGLAPESFYAESRTTAHYDGLPVDFVAAAIVAVGAQPHREIRTFHVLNYHDDGLSLDTFVDWIEAAGYAVEREPDHRRWIERFEDTLNALPEDERRHSSLSVLDSLRHPYDASKPPLGSRRFAAAVRALPLGEAPQLTREYIDKCLDDIRALGLVPEPGEDAADPEPLALAMPASA